VGSSALTKISLRGSWFDANSLAVTSQNSTNLRSITFKQCKPQRLAKDWEIIFPAISDGVEGPLRGDFIRCMIGDAPCFLSFEKNTKLEASDAHQYDDKDSEFDPFNGDNDMPEEAAVDLVRHVRGMGGWTDGAEYWMMDI
jgi:hypothetical protein